MNTCRANRGVAPLFLNVSARRRRRLVGFTFQPLYPEEPGYLVHRRGKVNRTGRVRVT